MADQDMSCVLDAVNIKESNAFDVLGMRIPIFIKLGIFHGKCVKRVVNLTPISLCNSTDL